MDAERWQRIEELFDRAIVLSGSERTTFLDVACGDDAELRREVATLLESDDAASDRIRDVVAASAEDLAHDARAAKIGRRIGAYRLQSLLGQGGMGAVYLATRDDAQFAHRVAIKILSHAVVSAEAIARFRDERQILAALEHPNIVRLLDGGSTDDDLPYLVMEHIEGRSITKYADERHLSIRARIVLVREVCAALQHAHRNLVIHRDIKPSNILVDGSGVPKLLDFGIAKLTTPLLEAEREARTRTGLAMFTPEYASPEQVRNQPVTTATDVYSLGAVLYELVTGVPPHQLPANVLEIVRILSEVEPARPSVVAPPTLRRELVGDLDNIILKALHKEPARRYLSIDDFDRDLANYLDGLPVSARNATLGYRARKFVRRNRAAVVAGVMVATVLVTATVVSLFQAARADEQARRADAAALTAEEEAHRARIEAERARKAEATARDAEARVQQQLDELRREQAARTKAEEEARVALQKAQQDEELARQQATRARTAEERAAAAAAAEKATRETAEALAKREKARADSAEKNSKQITTNLP
jgi:hypothetical protein